jgi:2-methylisocitrate lyase-like PEP mutase family enzyme
MTLKEKAAAFHALHTSDHPLALANAWDVASARVIEATGATAIATTSAGVAWSLGAADGDVLDRDRAVDLVARIAAAVGVPVTADIEGGFGATPGAVGETITQVIQAGAVGVNIEDTDRAGGGLRPVEEQVERYAAARAAATAAGLDLYVNARVDTYLRGIGADASARLNETVTRARAYLAAGASGIFVPGVIDAATIAELVRAIPAPINILAMPGAPAVRDLGALGVARVSLGSWVAEAAYALAQRAARDLITGGTYPTVESMDYGQLNDLLRG